MRKIWTFLLLGLLLVSILINKPVSSQAQEGTFCFAHITDNHVDGQLYYESRLRETVSYFNTVLRPPFIIDTGDTVTNAYQSSFQKYFNIIKNSQIKIYTVPGNHEHQGGIQYFNQIIGPSNVSFDYNSYRFVGFESLYGFIDYTWLEARLKEGTPGKIILFGHYPIETPSWAAASLMDPRARTPIKELVSKYGVIAYLSGHAHESFSVYNSQLRFWDIGAPATTHKNAYHLICLTNGQIAYYLLSIGQIPPINPTLPPITPTLTSTPTPSSNPTATPQPSVTPTPIINSGTIILEQNVNGYTGTTDTYIYLYDNGSNYCRNDSFKIGYKERNETLIRFDLAAISPGTAIQNAKLSIYAISWAGANCNISISAFKVLRDWNVCQTNWVRATSSTNWQNGGCNGILDRGTASLAALTTNGIRRWYDFDLTNTVRDWVNNPATNKGVLLRQSGSAAYTFNFASSENSNNRPRLTIAFQ